MNRAAGSSAFAFMVLMVVRFSFAEEPAKTAYEKNGPGKNIFTSASAAIGKVNPKIWFLQPMKSEPVKGKDTVFQRAYDRIQYGAQETEPAESSDEEETGAVPENEKPASVDAGAPEKKDPTASLATGPSEAGPTPPAARSDAPPAAE